MYLFRGSGLGVELNLNCLRQQASLGTVPLSAWYDTRLAVLLPDTELTDLPVVAMEQKIKATAEHQLHQSHRSEQCRGQRRWCKSRKGKQLSGECDDMRTDTISSSLNIKLGPIYSITLFV